MKIADEIVSDIIEELYSRGGFNSWWDDVDRYTQCEILQTLKQIVIKHLEGAEGR
jgi:hypothetical protein